LVHGGNAILNREDHFLQRLKPTQPAAFILGGRSPNGLSFVRSLGRRGIPVAAIDTVNGPGMRSRYCFPVQQPEVTNDDAPLLSFLEQIGQKLPTKGVVIATGDAYVLFLSKHRSALGKYYNSVLAEDSVLKTIANKKLQYKYAAKLGIPMPKTFSVGNGASIATIAEEMSYPCVIKPAYSHLWRRHRKQNAVTGMSKLAVADSPQQLIELYDQMSKSGVEMLVQEQVPGGDDRFYSLLTYLDRSSQPLAIFTKRKLRQWPVDHGDGSFQISVQEPQVAELGLRLLQGVGFRGLATVEFKKDPRNDTFKLIEVNPRSVLGQQLAVDCGVDLPYIAYQDALGEPVQPVEAFKSGVKWINLGYDVKSFLEYRRRKRLGLFAWLRSIKDARSYAYFAWDDPMPFVSTTLGLVGEEMTRRLGRKSSAPADGL
jgi:predicted ATP-grasp superfamily ATP-dependent carboligase